MKRGDVCLVSGSTPDIDTLRPPPPMTSPTSDCNDLVFESSLSTSLSEDDTVFVEALEDPRIVNALFGIVTPSVRATTMNMRSGGGARKPVKVKAISSATKRKIVSLK